MPSAYLFFTAVMALTGNLSLISTGEIDPFISIAGAGLLLGYFRAIRRRPPLSKPLIGVLAAAAFLVFLATSVIEADVLLGVARMTILFQAIKAFDMKTPFDPLQVAFVSLLQLLVASELTMSASFAVIFVVFLVVLVIFVVISHLVREGQTQFRFFSKPILAITAAVMVLSSLSFILLPRLHGGLWGRRHDRSIKTSGFSGQVDFGSFGEIKKDETVVMRATVTPDFPGPHYFRGMTFDFFNGTSWKDRLRDRNSVDRTENGFRLDSTPEHDFETGVFLEPIDSEVIFTLGIPGEIRSPGFLLFRDSAGSLFMRHRHARQFHYRMQASFGERRDKDHLVEYLQVPSGMEKVSRLAEETVAGLRDDAEKAARIRDFLRRGYTYSLAVEPPASGSGVIQDFLFTSKKGFCEHFATAMTLMLRSVGIPARLVTGFAGNQKNDIGDYYIIRQSDAHSWVEAFIGNKWKVYDPTPPEPVHGKKMFSLLFDTMSMAWEKYVVDFSQEDRKTLLHHAFRPGGWTGGRFKGKCDIPLFFVPLISFAVFIWLRVRRKDREGEISAAYRTFRNLVARRSGGKITESSTAEEVMDYAAEAGNFNPGAVRDFIRAYQRLRFSRTPDERLLREFRVLFRAVRKKPESF